MSEIKESTGIELELLASPDKKQACVGFGLQKRKIPGSFGRRLVCDPSMAFGAGFAIALRFVNGVIGPPKVIVYEAAKDGRNLKLKS